MRLISAMLACLLSFNFACSQAWAEAVASAYESIANQLYYAAHGTLPNSQTLANMESAFAAANAPTSAAGMASAYSTNAAVKAIIDSLGNDTAAGTSTQSFVNNIYQNLFNRPPNIAGLTFWSNAIQNGMVTNGNVVLSILAGASVQDLDTVNTNIQTAVTTAKAAEAAQLAKAVEEAKAAEAAKVATATKSVQSTDTSTGEGIINKVKHFVHKHPVATAVIAAVVVTAIATAITVPIAVHNYNASQNAANQRKMWNNLAVITRQRQLSAPRSVITTGSSSGQGGYVPPI